MLDAFEPDLISSPRDNWFCTVVPDRFDDCRSAFEGNGMSTLYFSWSLIGRAFSSFLSWVGESTLTPLLGLSRSLGVIVACLINLLDPVIWKGPGRDVLVRQILFTAIDGLGMAVRLGLAAGVLLIVQAALWLDRFGGEAELVTPFVMQIVVRELAPLVACLIVIGRSGTAIATELATMSVRGELEVLESMGVDLLLYLVTPRVVSAAWSVFSLAVMLVASMIASGYLVGSAMSAIRSPMTIFLEDLLRNAQWLDAVFFFSKTVLAGLYIGAVCCLEGFEAKPVATDIPRIASRAGVQALSGVFGVSAVLSLLIYGRVLIFQVL